MSQRDRTYRIRLYHRVDVGLPPSRERRFKRLWPQNAGSGDGAPKGRVTGRLTRFQRSRVVPGVATPLGAPDVTSFRFDKIAPRVRKTRGGLVASLGVGRSGSPAGSSVARSTTRRRQRRSSVSGRQSRRRSAAWLKKWISGAAHGAARCRFYVRLLLKRQRPLDTPLEGLQLSLGEHPQLARRPSPPPEVRSSGWQRDGRVLVMG